MAHDSIVLRLISFDFRLTGTDGAWSTLSRSYRFACQQRVLKTSPVCGYLHCQDGVVRLWYMRT